ncbi:anthranilate phosphoribosyltransferase [Chitinispirillales bacterium ANBcel5]|uniref:anthranilate phosphoribosyltransferase n=1 Tax=Cellulosispirillum alkaliphilum TaxID=3039283 RepID=UPI002A53DA70|nr:anthranilate phosphoribosyltransferase [Chitinispirillales bacterium ANBcel5]
MSTLEDFGGFITTLMSGEHLSKQQARECWQQIVTNNQPDLQQGAFMAALSMKGETAQEIAGTWEAVYELDTEKVDLSHLYPLVENCGTGMDSLKTFNISTAAAIIAASDGVTIARHGARALTSKCGTIDVLEHMGIDVEAPLEVVKESIHHCGIGIFNGMSEIVHPKALFRILSQIRFGSTLNIAGSLANPANPTHGVRGVYGPHLLKQTVETMKAIGYKRALVFHGYGSGENEGMDELSTLGNSLIYELDEKGVIHHYSISPEDFGIKRASYEQLKNAESVAEASQIVCRVLQNKATEAQRDIVLLNTAPLLYIADKVDTLEAGFAKAKDLLENGAAFEKLQEWVGCQNRNPSTGYKTLKLACAC